MKLGAKLLLFSFFLALLSCQHDKPSSDGIVNIVTTTGMIKDAVEHLVGEHAEVKALMGAGVDPHLYQATPGDLSKMNKADLVVYSGLFLEGKLDDIFHKLARTKNIINFSDAVSRDKLLDVTNAQFEGEIYDPHIWFDIDIWIEGISGLSAGLIQLYPEWKAEVEANRDSYIDELTALKAELIARIETVPEDDRIMVTSHDAFQYFGRMLQIRVEALQGISTATEFGLQDRKNLVDLIIDEDIKAIFIESSVGDKPIRAILSDCESRGNQIELGGILFSDAMGEQGTEEGTYVGMLRHNVNTVADGLQRE